MLDLQKIVYALCDEDGITGWNVSATEAEAEALLRHMATLPIKINTESLRIVPVTVAELHRQRGHYA